MVSTLWDRLVDSELRQRADRMGLRVNAFGYDRWGARPEVALRVLALVRWLYRHYFRVEATGLERLPSGRVLLVGNHSSQLAYDGMLVAAALALEAEPPRFTRAMIERFFAHLPVASILMTRSGQLTGIPANAERLLREEQATLLVFPEGARGGGKVWRDRYKLMGFGRGFMRLALATDTPIVPFGFIGGEEMCPSLSRLEPLAKLVGAPYLPLMPTAALPLPAKVSIHFGEPLRFSGRGDEDDERLGDCVGRVEGAVSGLIELGLRQRRSVFFG